MEAPGQTFTHWSTGCLEEGWVHLCCDCHVSTCSSLQSPCTDLSGSPGVGACCDQQCRPHVPSQSLGTPTLTLTCIKAHGNPLGQCLPVRLAGQQDPEAEGGCVHTPQPSRRTGSLGRVLSSLRAGGSQDPPCLGPGGPAAGLQFVLWV